MELSLPVGPNRAQAERCPLSPFGTVWESHRRLRNDKSETGEAGMGSRSEAVAPRKCVSRTGNTPFDL